MVGMETETVPEETGTARAGIVTEDTVVEAGTMTMAAERDTTKVMDTMIHAANEGISLLDYGIGLLGGSPFTLGLSSHAPG